MSGQRILDGLREAIAGNLTRVTIDGQTWQRVGPLGGRSILLDQVRKLIPSGEIVSVSEIIEGVANSGIQAEPEQIYNSLGYLVRHGEIIRLDYGRYTRPSPSEPEQGREETP